MWYFVQSMVAKYRSQATKIETVELLSCLRYVVNFSEAYNRTLITNYVLVLRPGLGSRWSIKRMVSQMCKDQQSIVAQGSRLREPGFESCAVVLNLGQYFFILDCSSSLSCINEHLAIDCG